MKISAQLIIFFLSSGHHYHGVNSAASIGPWRNRVSSFPIVVGRDSSSSSSFPSSSSSSSSLLSPSLSKASTIISTNHDVGNGCSSSSRDNTNSVPLEIENNDVVDEEDMPLRHSDSNLMARGGNMSTAAASTTDEETNENTGSLLNTTTSVSSQIESDEKEASHLLESTTTRRKEIKKSVTDVVSSTPPTATTTLDPAPPKKRKLFKIKRKKKTVDPNSTAARYAKKLKNRNSMNIRRKVLHTSWGFIFAALNHFMPPRQFMTGMLIVSTGTLAMELLRYRRGFGFLNDILHFCLGSQLRKHEMEGKFTGSLYYFMGVTTSAYCFPKTAATMGIFQLALADPAASYFGRHTRHIYWSRIENGFFGLGRNKGILGFLGGALVCLPFNYRVFKVAKWGASGVPGGRGNLATASLLLGAAGAFADLIVPTPALTMPSKVFGVPMPPFHVDDNFVVPVVSSFACTKIFELLGWDSAVALGKYILV